MQKTDPTPNAQHLTLNAFFAGDGLFSAHYLTDRLPQTELFADAKEADAARAPLRNVYQLVKNALPGGNEEDVEDRLVAPILIALGFGFEKRRVLSSGSGAKQFPDFLLYANPDAAHNAFQKSDYWPDCLGLLEAKRWSVALQTPATRKERSPHLQLRDYLNERPNIGYGILTNGGEWRLYAQTAPASEFFSVNLAAVLDAPDDDKSAAFAFRLFYTLFRRRAFDNKGQILTDARAGAERFREEIEAQLRLQVFDAMETLAGGFLAHPENALDADDLTDVFNNTLILLYRILFVLNAEARDLLPMDANSAYFQSNGLEFVRRKLASPVTAAEYDDDGNFALWGRLEGLFALINGDNGDRNERLGVPRYNGGLFDPSRYPFLKQKKVGDAYLSRALQTLTFRKEPGGGVTAFDYAGLGERHLGSIYEGLLEHRLETLSPSLNPSAVGALLAAPSALLAAPSLSVTEGAASSGEGAASNAPTSALPSGGNGRVYRIQLRNDKGERKTQGAYYTPQDFVAYIVKATLTPLLERIETREDVRNNVADSFANAVMEMNVCDPAMGSGHFLVEAVAVLADAVAAHPTTDTGDVAYWKRRVVEACIYGVDYNPLAVELAKLSLWLKTVDRVPLNFLDHHLLCGNSLIGTALDALPRFPDSKKNRRIDAAGGPPSRASAGDPPLMGGRGASRKAVGTAVQLPLTFAGDLSDALKEAIAGIHAIERQATDTHAVAKDKERIWRDLSENIVPRFTAVADLWTLPYFGGNLSWVRYLAAMDDADAARAVRAEYAAALDAVRPFHWELAFPDVFFDEKGTKKKDPGFDAVMGNPPWERVKLAENEFFAARNPAIAGATRAADRKKLIAALPLTDPTLWADYERARDAAERTAAFLQTSGFYPLMGRGDTNLYAVFVEKATQIAARSGRVGLLVPSGVATDATTSAFFRHIVEQKRLSELLDFENRGVFPDVDGRFKFSILVLAGEDAPQSAARCGFFLHAIADIDDAERTFPLAPADFAVFNPNTLTCPIFRRRRDAELTRKIYAAAPILVSRREVANRRDAEEEKGSVSEGFANAGEGFANAGEGFANAGEGFANAGEGFANAGEEKSGVPEEEIRAPLASGDAPETRRDTPEQNLRTPEDGRGTPEDNLQVPPDFRRVPLASGEAAPPPATLRPTSYDLLPNPWGVRFLRMFDMTNDSGKFKTFAELDADGFWLGDGNIFTKGTVRCLPLYEGKMVQMYDHRAASVKINPENQFRAAQESPATPADRANPDFSPLPQYWVEEEDVKAQCGDPENPPAFLLPYKSVTAPTNARSVIPAAIPFAGVGNSMAVLQVAENVPAYCLLANLSSFVLDYAARQKIGGQNLNFFIVEQFPVIPPERYEEVRDGVKLADFVRERVLELVYVAHDMKNFARALGYDGAPFPYDEERRLHLRCQLDALYFLLYNLDAGETGEILDTFPIVKRHDEAKYAGKYRTKDLILNYRKAYAAGNWDAKVRG